MEKTERVVWVDWMRVLACLMVMVVHSAEPFYLGGDGSLIANASDGYWVAFFDSFVRCCVPLFVIASSFLQFPLHYPAKEFLRRRAARILIPFVIWSLFYAFYWGDSVSNLKGLLLNFNYAAGHLWFVYMILGLYLLMPLLSPWAEKAGRKELTAYICIWLFTTLIPLFRDWASGGQLAITYGPTGIPRQALFPLWGEACWNTYGTFYYLSGFVGYLLVGLWFRKFGSGITAGKSLAAGIPCFIGGFAICFSGFLKRVSATSGGIFPAAGPVNDAVYWETTWCYDSAGVALMTIGTVLVLRIISSDGWVYRNVILPVSKASYGMYLGHMVALAFFAGLYRGLIPSTPLVILATAASSFTVSAIVAVLIRRIPVIGRYIIG